jgi:hypothetical protein
MRSQRRDEARRERARADGRLAQMADKNSKLLRDYNAMRDQCAGLRNELADEKAARTAEASMQGVEIVKLRKIIQYDCDMIRRLEIAAAEQSEIFDESLEQFREQIAEIKHLRTVVLARQGEIQQLREAVLEGLNRTIYVMERCWQEGADAGLMLMTRFSEMAVLCDRPLVADQHFMVAVHAARAANVAAGRIDLQRI